MPDDPRTRIAAWRVRDVMSSPIRACAPDVPLVAAARLMADERIHCLAVVERPEEGEAGGFQGIVTDLELIAALDSVNPPRSVGELAQAPLESVAADAPLTEAVHEMHERRIHHLVVVAQGSGRPVGVLSTLDVAQALATADEALPE